MPPATSSAATTTFALSAAVASGTLISSVMRTAGRPGGNRTPNLRFWRPPLCQLNYKPTVLKLFLLGDLRNDAGTDRLATFTYGETQALFHRDGADQLHLHLDVVARHDHLDAFRQLHESRHVRRAEVELRPVALEERRMTTALFLRQHVHLGLEADVRGDRTGLRQHLATLHFFALRATEEHTDVVARLAFIQQLAEHLDARAGGLHGRLETDDLDFVVRLDDAALDTN